MNKLKNKTWLILLLILIMQLCLRLPFLGEPLEGDEGIYSSIAMWLDHGDILYKDLIDLKPPLLFYIYLFVFKFFGWSALALRVFSMFYGFLTTLVVFLIGKELIDKNAGLLSALFYAIFSGGPLIEGAGANSEVFMILPMLLAFYFFIKGIKVGDRRRLFWAGLLSGTAIMIKQVAFLNFIVLFGWLLIRDRKSLLQFTIGSLVVPFLFVAYFMSKGALVDFFSSTFLYGVRNISPNVLFFMFRTLYIMVMENSIIWILAILGAIHIWRARPSADLKLLTVWAGFSFLGVYIGGYAFGHYYIQVIPALAMLSAVAIIYRNEIFKTKISRSFIIGLLVLLGLVILSAQYKYYLVYSPEQISIAKYGGPVNVIAREIGFKIKTRTKPDDLVFPRLLYQIPLYSGRRSASKCYQSLGGGYQVLGPSGKVLYSYDFRTRQRADLLAKENKDFYQALTNPRTKYFIYQPAYAPADIKNRLKRYGYYPDKQLSYPKYGVLVYRRS